MSQKWMEPYLKGCGFSVYSSANTLTDFFFPNYRFGKAREIFLTTC